MIYLLTLVTISSRPDFFESVISGGPFLHVFDRKIFSIFWAFCPDTQVVVPLYALIERALPFEKRSKDNISKHSLSPDNSVLWFSST